MRRLRLQIKSEKGHQSILPHKACERRTCSTEKAEKGFPDRPNGWTRETNAAHQQRLFMALPANYKLKNRLTPTNGMTRKAKIAHAKMMRCAKTHTRTDTQQQKRMRAAGEGKTTNNSICTTGSRAWVYMGRNRHSSHGRWRLAQMRAPRAWWRTEGRVRATNGLWYPRPAVRTC